MKNNRIKGIVPFNGFFYKSCYHQQLISGLSCFGIDRDNVLLNNFFELLEDFEVEEKFLNSTKKFQKLAGYNVKECNINKGSLARSIDKGMPLIVGVDCYYFESKQDTYMEKHDPHYILVYGYDFKQDIAYVVDHAYRNSSQYIEKVVSLSNLLLANRMFRFGVNQRRHTCRKLIKRKGKLGYSIWRGLDINILAKSRENGAANLKELKRMILNDIEMLQCRIEKIIKYLQLVKMWYFTLQKTSFFSSLEQRRNTVEQLVNGYSNLLSLCWKLNAQNDFTYLEKKQDNILRKIEEIIFLESQVYEFMAEAVNGAV